MTSNPRLEFVAAPALAPAEVAIDANLMKQYEQELKQVSSLRNLAASFDEPAFRRKLFLFLRKKTISKPALSSTNVYLFMLSFYTS